MVENSDILVAYVIKDTGGAADCLRYAGDKEVEIVNITREK